jgi:hypothetical protein
MYEVKGYSNGKSLYSFRLTSLGIISDHNEQEKYHANDVKRTLLLTSAVQV